MIAYPLSDRVFSEQCSNLITELYAEYRGPAGHFAQQDLINTKRTD
ncbi:hypothetical protein ALT785_440020 [Alteromonas infernus]